MATAPLPADTLRVLIATDNHLGYAEKDPIRGNDSFDAFEEILQLALEHRADMLLLAGDLFHDNKPSRKTMHRTLELLRHYCLGSRPCYLELLSDPSVNFPNRFGTVNYEDPNFNVALPVFSIHGNHDDPSGDANLAALDILSAAGLVNYFGKSREVDDVTVSPILLKKGNTGMALYGLGSIRDQRLHHTFLSRKVKMLRPSDADARTTGLRAEEWFNLLLFHQNRVAHSSSGFIPESFLDDFLHLVIWGHEHDCRIDPEECADRAFFVCQPGSSVATSLSEGECNRAKAVALVDIFGTEFQLTPIILRTVRPFAMREVSLRAAPGLSENINDAKKIEKFLHKQVNELIAACEAEWRERNGDIECPLPLVRLRVDYSGGFQPLNPQRFGQIFQKRVANVREIVHFYHKRQAAMDHKRLDVEIARPAMKSADVQVVRVEDLVGEYLSAQSLHLFAQNEFNDSVRIYVEKDDRDAIDGFIKSALQRLWANLDQQNTLVEETVLKGEIERARRVREAEWSRMHSGMDAIISHHGASVERANAVGIESAKKKSFAATRGRKGGASSQSKKGFPNEEIIAVNSESDHEPAGNAIAVGHRRSRPAALKFADSSAISQTPFAQAPRQRIDGLRDANK